jgi:hypothetical protein
MDIDTGGVEVLAAHGGEPAENKQNREQSGMFHAAIREGGSGKWQQGRQAIFKDKFLVSLTRGDCK